LFGQSIKATLFLIFHKRRLTILATTENLNTLKIHKLSQEQYDREKEAGRLDNSAIYLTPYESDGYILPAAGDSLGGVKTGGDVTISGGVITINDDSHSHTIANIDDLQTALNNKAATDHDHNISDVTGLQDALNNSAAKTHSHAISEVNDLQTALDGKAASSHGTHVTYSTTNPVMNGTASAGSSTDVSRGDHVHPTDTSRAPTSHASSENTYGLGTSTDNDLSGGSYGHVKLYNGDLNGKAHLAGTVAGLGHTHSQYASSSHTHGDITNAGELKTASRIVVTDTNKKVTTGTIDPASLVVTTDSRLSDSRTPKSHASSDTTYGVGTTDSYGHVKISNDDVNTVASANGLAAGMDHSHGNYMQKTAFNYNSTTGVLTITTT
jgi:hypothetical protein